MASAQQNGHLNGVNGASDGVFTSKRFADVPATLDIPVQDQEDEAVEIDLTNLMDDPSDLCDLFEAEHAARTYWMAVALAYAKQRKVDYAIETLIRGNALQTISQRDKLSLVSCLCWMYLWKSREAPRVAPEGHLAPEAKTKEYYLQQATATLNEASRINPAFPPLFLARGVLYLLRASLQPPSKSGGTGSIDPEKAELLRSALKSFEDAIRVSFGKNMLAVMGKARALFSMAKYPEALSAYQDVLQKMPDMVDPDPRIGIGCCFWQLGFKDDAKAAWERALEINPNSKVGNILLGLFYLDSSGHIPTNSPDFIRLYKKAMTEYTQRSFKLDKDFPLTCATFAGYFLSRKNYANVDSLAHKAIQYTDVNAIASDGWYLLARKEHYAGDADRASDHYKRADDARGGDQRGYLPAKFGQAQLLVMKNDLPGARYHLEKMNKQVRNHETMTLLGTIYAEEVFANEAASVKENKTNEAKQAVILLEGVRAAWKDPQKNVAPDASVLLNLARLYENDHPDKALQCLQQVEQMELDQIPDSAIPSDITEESAKKAAKRRLLSPQLLNNIGCFYSQAEKHEFGSELFEVALDSCMRIEETGDNEDMDTDALVTTISFNLGRSYESRGLVDKAVDIYERLLKRHDDYTDARTRLAYIKLRMNPNKEGPETVSKLYTEQPSDAEVRALYGWYLSKVTSKKRPQNLNEDHEYRTFKRTLQQLDKHDRYALVSMGNMHLSHARETRVHTEADKQRREKEYNKSVEFFDKALQLDSNNAFAAQGMAIALAEAKKDYRTALSILLQVRETIKDANVYMNLGHTYHELKQYSKAIESYEMALSKEGKSKDTMLISCLGRTWLARGKASVSAAHGQKIPPEINAYYKALELAKKALEIAPEQVHFKFNVAYVQIQLAMTLRDMGETDRTLQQLQEAADGLESAITTLGEVANRPDTPFPKHELEQRANMAQNTQRNQLQRAIDQQKQYEEKNKEKVQAAMEQRQAEQRRREEERRKIEEVERERKEKIRKEREGIAARDREIAERRAREERERLEAEMTEDSQGERVKRKRKPAARSKGEGGDRKRRSKKRREEEEGGDEGEGDESDEEQQRERQPKKKRRLTKKENSKYKSAEFINDSDADSPAPSRREDSPASAISSPEPLPDSDDEGGAGRMDVDKAASPVEAGGGDDDEEEGGVQRRKRARRGRVLESDDEGDDEDGAPAPEKSKASPEADTAMADGSDDE
ncbi:tetratricopeptide repeat protein 1 [Diaporthe sp. PMI_573]|nr:tetratricopeptide repeat protein 1 [Diaporthaceae sp. PMI_573]